MAVKELTAEKEIGGRKFYSLKSVQTFFGITDKTMRKYIRNANIQPIRIGHVTYISESDLLRLVEPRR